MQMTLRSRAVLVLGCGLLAISTASIFIKLCAAPALTITLYRVGLASIFYFGLYRLRGCSLHKVYKRTQLILALLSGMALSLHFITWISSLNYTSITSSVVLVVTSPIWVALGSTIFLREKPTGLLILGIFLTATGSIIISGADFSVDPTRLLGNVLALAGALFVAVYLIIGRRLRESMETLPYVIAVYGSAALVTMVFILIGGTPVAGFNGATYLLLLAISLLPQVVGHTSFNWALKYFSATTVAIVSLGEPVGASILAWLILGEAITMMQFFGGAIILAGLILSLLVEARRIKSGT
ncbi:DMT family transporter [candidate division KSB1 bacterium]|nr:DMT family transporter [candidate division KSB1 bacterium]RQW03354.1 MAG: DMT family transporter [candidate division KSB1 bacterium]